MDVDRQWRRCWLEEVLAWEGTCVIILRGMRQ